MSTRIKSIKGEARESLHGIAQSTYLDGNCYAFAIALHQGLGWPLVGLIQAPLGVPRHAAVYGPDKRLHDVRGAMDQNDPAFGKPFGYGPPYPLEQITEEQLYKVRQIDGRSIIHARRMAEMLWPYLPWQHSEASRIRAFADELEALCRKHKFWIRSVVPGAKPMLARSKDDEGGYELRPTDDGLTYTIDRYFP